MVYGDIITQPKQDSKGRWAISMNSLSILSCLRPQLTEIYIIVDFQHGTTTISITTLSMTTFSIRTHSMKGLYKKLDHYAECHYAEYRYAKCRGDSRVTSSRHRIADVFTEKIANVNTALEKNRNLKV